MAPPVGYEEGLEVEVVVEPLIEQGPPSEVVVEPYVPDVPTEPGQPGTPPPTPPPPPPPVSPNLIARNRLYERLDPIHDADEVNDLLLDLCEAVTYPQAALENIIRGDDDFDPFERAVDLEEAPLWLLPWLSCLVGEEWGGPSSEVLREQIRDRPRRRRGTPAAIIAAVKRTLTGSKTATLVTRVGGNPNVIFLQTIPSQTPAPTYTYNEVLRVAPAWVQLSNIVSDQLTYAELDAQNATYVNAQGKYGIYANLRADNPV